jgi:hypothetical protein
MSRGARPDIIMRRRQGRNLKVRLALPAGQRPSAKQLVILTSGGLPFGRVFAELPEPGQLISRGRWRVLAVRPGDRAAGAAATAEGLGRRPHARHGAVLAAREGGEERG